MNSSWLLEATTTNSTFGLSTTTMSQQVSSLVTSQQSKLLPGHLISMDFLRVAVALLTDA